MNLKTFALTLALSTASIYAVSAGLLPVAAYADNDGGSDHDSGGNDNDGGSNHDSGSNDNDGGSNHNSGGNDNDSGSRLSNSQSRSNSSSDDASGCAVGTNCGK